MTSRRIAFIVLAAALVVVLYVGMANAQTFDTSQELETVGRINPSPSLFAVATSIATAEGFYVQGSIPQRANNPGDLVLGDIGYGVLGPGKITVFQNIDDGWQALYHELTLIYTGTSRVYHQAAQTTIAALAQTWTGGDAPQNWANIVALKLGVTPDATLAEVMG